MTRTQCWLLAGDRTTEPLTVISREPDGDRRIDAIDIGGAWAAEWLGPPADCVMTRADRTEPFQSLIRAQVAAPMRT
jgi:hypothetical protein